MRKAQYNPNKATRTNRQARPEREKTRKCGSTLKRTQYIQTQYIQTNPVQTAPEEWTGEEEMFRRLKIVTAETRWLVLLVAKRNQAFYSVEHSVSNLPAEISDFSIQRHELQRFPCCRPVKRSKRWHKFLDTVQLDWIQVKK